MALSKSALSSDILSVFNSMKNRINDEDNPPTNKDFADGISNAIVTFVSTGSVSTNDGGTVPTGTFSGSGKGTLTVTATNCSSIILSACNEMNQESKSNDYLAQELGKAIKTMSDEGVVSTTVIGTMTPPTGSAITGYSGTAKGTINCNKTDLVNTLKATFSEMDRRKTEKDFDGNKYFADEIAEAVYDFYKNGSINTDGLLNLAGSSGSGSIS